jgi:hypothetical protein
MSVTRLMRQNVSIEPFTGESAKGPVYGAAFTARCRVQESDDVQAGREGSADRHEVTSATTVYLPYATDCPARSRITLPSGEVGTAVKVDKQWESPRVRHLRVAVQ